jgi:hypothetical protein
LSVSEDCHKKELDRTHVHRPARKYLLVGMMMMGDVTLVEAAAETQAVLRIDISHAIKLRDS